MAGSSLFSIGLSGLAAAQRRLETAAGNIANSASAGSEATAFRPQRTTTEATPDGGVVARTQAVSPPFVQLFAPDHPEAAADGSVFFPNISLARETVEIKTAEAGYKASARLIETASELQDSLLDITDDDTRR